MKKSKRLTAILTAAILVLMILDYYGFMYYRLADLIGI